MKQNNKRKRKRKNNQEVKVQEKREIQKPTEYTWYKYRHIYAVIVKVKLFFFQIV